MNGLNTQSVPNFAAPRVLNRPHSITADVEIPEQGAEGVLLSQGTAAGGYSFKRTLKKPGTYKFLCDLHEGMRMTVVVK